jgi:chaperonin cofactor prefoldin
MSGNDAVKSFETLDVQVKALEGDVRDIKTSISNLGAEVRSTMADVTRQFAQQQRTPWVSIGSVGGVFVAVLGFMVFQTVTPMQSDIKILKDEIVPRVEHNYRQDATNRLFEDINKRLEQTQNRKYDDMNKAIEHLENENRELKRK